MTFEECKKFEIPIGRAKDISSEKFGMLKPIFRVDNSIKGRASWACLCDCGDYKIVTTNDLKKGDVKTCGNHRKFSGNYFSKKMEYIKKDLTNEKFGKIKVLEKDKESKGFVTWKCECDCGEKFIASSRELLINKKTKCNNHIINTTVGKRFGSLEVISFIDYRDNVPYFLCKCDCGKIIERHGYYIRSGLIQSCGCSINRITNIRGQRFGKLVAREVVKNINNNTTCKSCVWLCDCDCGNTVSVYSHSLLSGHTRSCGCLKKSVGEYEIDLILQKENIQYTPQKSFDSCRFPDTNQMGMFDFYLIDKQEIIEFDGIQHITYKNSDWDTKEKFVITHNHDLYKNQWAWDNNISMKRIPYSERDKLNLDRILSNEFLITPQTHPWWYPSLNSSYPYFTFENIDNIKEVS